jgi:RND superfamily putative drug exporter
MLLPIGTALAGIGCGVLMIGLLTRVLAVPDFTTQVAALIGIGVGIDYALLIITRYRKGLHEGLEPRTAVVFAIDTSGRAVVFAGITVVISLLGMFMMNLDFMRSVSLSAVLAVLFTMGAAVTLLPALMGFVGYNVDRWSAATPVNALLNRVTGKSTAPATLAADMPATAAAPPSSRGIPIVSPVLGFFRGLVKEAPAPRTRPSFASVGESGNAFWYRWSRIMQAHPWPAVIISASLLVVLAIPVFSMRLGFGDAGNRLQTDTTRRAYDLLSEAFGPGFNGPILMVVDMPGGSADQARLATLVDDFKKTPGVASVTAPNVIPNANLALVNVFPTTSPQDKATADLVHRLRDEVIPPALAGSDVRALAFGMPPAVVDFADYVGGRLPIFIGAVLVLSFVLLMIVFHSVVVPLKAVIMNMLSIGAAFGVMVAVFQWGYFSSLIGLGKEGPIESWGPMMMFAIVFGLSMDYEVFLLSRVREEYDKHHDNREAVADGLATTGRVISAAAAIMVCVFGAFILGDDRAIKLVGFGLAVAIFIDATVVRLVLVPATMELLGDMNWWMPQWLGRRLPRVRVEGREVLEGTPAPAGGAD